MAALISVYNSSGLVGHCDARCYDATSLYCQCICGGANHGAGEQKATKNTQRMAEEWIAEYTQSKKFGKDAKWLVPAAQLALL